MLGSFFLKRDEHGGRKSRHRETRHGSAQLNLFLPFLQTTRGGSTANCMNCHSVPAFCTELAATSRNSLTSRTQNAPSGTHNPVHRLIVNHSDSRNCEKLRKSQKRVMTKGSVGTSLPFINIRDMLTTVISSRAENVLGG